jgi:hypothetical protein
MPEHKGLYAWAINEIDDQGQQVGHDQIPWGWNLRFTATSCVVGDSIEIKSNYPTGEATPPSEVAQRRIIRVQLRPGSPRDDGDFFRQTIFRMFGTDRVIKNFQLDISPTDDPAEQESCRAWGAPAYTYETDFRNEKSEDCLVFYLSVKPDAFARYAALVADGSVDEMILSVGLVYGFYSEWSPSISTRSVKVLTADREHKVELPPGLQTEPPRLGHVGDATLYINRNLVLGKETPDPEPAEEPSRVATAAPIPEMPAPELALTDPRILKALASLRRAAWFIVVLLALILLTVPFR